MPLPSRTQTPQIDKTGHRSVETKASLGIEWTAPAWCPLLVAGCVLKVWRAHVTVATLNLRRP